MGSSRFVYLSHCSLVLYRCGSHLDRNTGCLGRFHDFPHIRLENSGVVLRLGDNCFLPNPF
jgi:hypothetical protein